jgi:hypothetical protein
MPLHRGHDSKGSFWQWGDRKKYYYTTGSATSRLQAKKKAIKQAVAISYHSKKSIII